MSPAAGNRVPQKVCAGVLVTRKDLTGPHAAVAPKRSWALGWLRLEAGETICNFKDSKGRGLGVGSAGTVLGVTLGGLWVSTPPLPGHSLWG